MKKSILFLLIATILVSCGSLNFEKRRYNRGYYLNWSKPINSDRTQKTENSPSSNTVEVNEDSSIDKNNPKHHSKSNHNIEFDADTALNNSIGQPNIQLAKDKLTAIKPSDKSKENKVSKAQRSHETTFKKSNEPNLHDGRTKKISGAWFYLILSSIPFLYLFRNRTSKLSNWAFNNPQKSRRLIALFSATGALSSFALGSISNFEVDNSMAIATMGVFGFSVLLNSTKFTKGSNFLKTKTSFLLTGITGFSGTFGLGAKYGQMALTPLQAGEGEMLLHPILAIFLTILIIVALAASLYGLAILSCTVACNGSGFFAVVLLLGGTFLLFMLATLGIQYLFRREGQSNERFLRNSVFVGLGVSGLILLFGLILTILETL